MATGSPWRLKLLDNAHKPSIRRQRLELLRDTFLSKGVPAFHYVKMDPVLVGKFPWASHINWQTKCHVFDLWGAWVHVPLDYYYQPDQEWLAESIVTEYVLSNYDRIPTFRLWFTPAGIHRQIRFLDY